MLISPFGRPAAGFRAVEREVVPQPELVCREVGGHTGGDGEDGTHFAVAYELAQETARHSLSSRGFEREDLQHFQLPVSASEVEESDRLSAAGLSRNPEPTSLRRFGVDRFREEAQFVRVGVDCGDYLLDVREHIVRLLENRDSSQLSFSLAGR